MIIQVDGVTFSYNSHPVLRDVNLTVHPGKVLGIVGPNGSGKSTLLKLMSRALSPDRGEVVLQQMPLRRVPRHVLARLMAVVHQRETVGFDFSVEEVVLMGRLPHLGRFGREDDADRHAVDLALREMGIAHLADRPVSKLSGGEYQRVAIARALAQDTSVLLLDEPTSSLDIGHQTQLLGLLRRLADKGRTVVLTMHDLNLASSHCDCLLLLHQGRVRAVGTPDQVLTPSLLEEVYQVAVTVIRRPDTGSPLVLPNSQASAKRRA